MSDRRNAIIWWSWWKPFWLKFQVRKHLTKAKVRPHFPLTLVSLFRRRPWTPNRNFRWFQRVQRFHGPARHFSISTSNFRFSSLFWRLEALSARTRCAVSRFPVFSPPFSNLFPSDKLRGLELRDAWRELNPTKNETLGYTFSTMPWPGFVARPDRILFNFFDVLNVVKDYSSSMRVQESRNTARRNVCFAEASVLCLCAFFFFFFWDADIDGIFIGKSAQRGCTRPKLILRTWNARWCSWQLHLRWLFTDSCFGVSGGEFLLSRSLCSVALDSWCQTSQRCGESRVIHKEKIIILQITWC